MSIAATLVIVSVMSGAIPAPMVNVTTLESREVCNRVLKTSVEGVKMVYTGNSMMQEIVSSEENGWTILKAGATQRVVAQFKCN